MQQDDYLTTTLQEAISNARWALSQSNCNEQNGVVQINPEFTSFVTSTKHHDTPYPITIHQYPQESSELARGAVIIFGENERAEIVLKEEMSFCWKRFVICKELFHCIWDLPEEHESLGAEKNLAQARFNAVLLDAVSADGQLQIHAEVATWIQALEFILPWNKRQEITDMLASKASFKKIAEHFRCPEQVVEVFISTRYSEISARINTQLDESNTNCL